MLRTVTDCNLRCILSILEISFDLKPSVTLATFKRLSSRLRNNQNILHSYKKNEYFCIIMHSQWITAVPVL